MNNMSARGIVSIVRVVSSPRLGPLTTTFVIGSLISGSPAQCDETWTERSPAVASQSPQRHELSASDWSGILAAYEADRHAVLAAEGGHQARNPGQKWTTRFDGRGFVTTPDAGGWSWGLELVSYGVDGAEGAVSAPKCVAAGLPIPQGKGRGEGGRCISYHWDAALTEWYINDSRGLEHGYTLHGRPACRMEAADKRRDSSARRAGRQGEPFPGADASGNHRASCPENRAIFINQDAAGPHGGSGRSGPLRLTLAVRGGLSPQVNMNGRDVTFVDDSGAAVVNYGGLTVFDARGRTLPAWFTAGSVLESGVGDPLEISLIARSLSAASKTRRGGAGHSRLLSIVVNDAGATYPLTIDPLAQQAYLKALNTGPGDQFGFSVAVSGDTVVVGAPNEDSNAVGVDGDHADNSIASSGAAYVFVRNGTSWTQQAYLKASNTGANDNFGYSVAVSGETVVVGALNEASNATGVNGNQTNNNAGLSGAAYVFVRSGTTWSQQAYLMS